MYCDAPINGTNTEYVSSNLTVGYKQAYTYKCLDEYLPSEDGLMSVCMADGSWSLSSPKCYLGKVLQVSTIELFKSTIELFEFTIKLLHVISKEHLCCRNTIHSIL